MATKAVRGQKLANELVSLADKLEGRFRKAFLRSMLSIAEDPELQKLIRDIEAGRFTFGDAIDARLSAVRIDLAEMNEIARQAIAGSAKVTNQVMGLKGSFDVINDSVVNAAKNLSIDLSTYLRKSTQETLRQVIEDLIGSNISRSEAVRRITLEVGLLPQHAKAVSNYRRTLIAAGESRSRANQLAEAYAKRLLKYRANMISRTEVARATGIGQTEFWRQMRDQGSLPPQVNRVWITSLDERACDFCRSMNGQVASIDGGWETINGYKEYPQASHPHCRCSSGITTNRMTKTGKMGVIAKVEEIEYEYWLSKHLGGKHDQRMHAGRRGAVDAAMASGSSTEGTTPKAPKKTARQKIVDSLTLGVDYDSDGYPLDNESGIVAQKLMDIHGLYDEPSDSAMMIAGRGPKKLILPLDKNGLPQILPLKQAEKRYGKTPEEVISKVKKDFGVEITVKNGDRDIDATMDTLHGTAQAIEEMSMNGIPVSQMVTSVNIKIGGLIDGKLGSFSPFTKEIEIMGSNINARTVGESSPRVLTRNFLTDTEFVRVGTPYGESTARGAYGTTIHEFGHAMDLYVGTQIQQTRKKIINEVFEGTGLIRSDWAETPKGKQILYTDRESNATAFYNDLGARYEVALQRNGLIDPEQPPRMGSIGDRISISQYSTYNMRENFAETFTSYWLYGGSKGKYKKYYDGYKERVGNIVDMSQGVIKVVNPADSGVIITDITQLPPSHPLVVWITGIVPS